MRNRWASQYHNQTLSYWQHLIQIIRQSRKTPGEPRVDLVGHTDSSVNTDGASYDPAEEHYYETKAGGWEGGTAAQQHVRMDNVMNNAQETIVTASTIFPFNIFPDTITVDRVKITVTRKVFWKMAETVSIQIEDVLNVGGSVGPLYGSLKLWTRFFQEEPYVIEHLSRSKVMEIKQVLQGYVIARQKNLDCSNISVSELLPMLKTLGSESTSSSSSGKPIKHQA